MPKLPSIILGVTYGHGDSSAALIVDGCLIAAAEEERFTRVKHCAWFPKGAIQYCLRHAQIAPKEVQVIALARDPRAHLRKRLKLWWAHPNVFQSRNSRGSRPQDRESLSVCLKQAGLKRAKILRFEHHLAHLLSARYLTPGNDFALLSFDGLGDFTSAAMGRPIDSGVEVLDRVYFPHSLGYFFSAMTQYLGFPHFGDEYKVMGLSSYGKPRYLNAMRELIREEEGFGFQLNLEAFPILKNPMHFFIEDGQPKIDVFFHRAFLTQLTGIPARKPKDPLNEEHWDLAKSVQARFEEIANHLARKVYEKFPAKTIALSGGCAHNSVWVGKIPASTPFKKVVVAPASHDAGLAVGAAIGASQVQVNPEGQSWALLGVDVSETAENMPEQLPFPCQDKSFQSEAALIEWMVSELVQKRIIGVFRGRMEFGPRALGNRSILADPRFPEMKDKLNERVKHREWFRPFAAAVLWDNQPDWFDGSFFSPAMEAVFTVNEKVRNRIPGVVHIDKTCRVQSVKHDTQPFLWNLIECFRKKTGVPMLINTSFNDSEPIVCSQQDAWNCFLHCELDHLVIGSRAFTRVRQAVPSAA